MTREKAARAQARAFFARQLVGADEPALRKGWTADSRGGVIVARKQGRNGHFVELQVHQAEPAWDGQPRVRVIGYTGTDSAGLDLSAPVIWHFQRTESWTGDFAQGDFYSLESALRQCENARLSNALLSGRFCQEYAEEIARELVAA